VSEVDNTLGAVPLSDGSTRFRVWAPRAREVAVLVGGETRALEPAADGVFEGVLRAGPGEDYRFVLDGRDALPDPCSRHQPEGIEGPSRIVRPLSVERLGLALD
jgi:maltooligosyltrehalose trehalohydrolase